MMWKKLGIATLFDIRFPKHDLQASRLSAGPVPLISASFRNNGICAFIPQDAGSELFAAGNITVNRFGYAFYQPRPFFAVSHGDVNVLVPKRHLSESQGLFLQSLINISLAGRYPYSFKCTSGRLAAETVPVPATEDGEPDWDRMEQRMRAVMEGQGSVLANLRLLMERA